MSEEGISKVEKIKRTPGKPKGSRKSGGRKAGTPNKRSLWLCDTLHGVGFDWSVELKRAYADLDYRRIELLQQLLPYLAPRLKEIEKGSPEGETESDLSGKSTEELLKIAKS